MLYIPHDPSFCHFPILPLRVGRVVEVPKWRGAQNAESFRFIAEWQGDFKCTVVQNSQTWVQLGKISADDIKQWFSGRSESS